MPDFVPGPSGAGWTAMPVTQSHANSIHEFAAGWTWSGAPTAVIGTGNASGTGVFSFRVYKNVAGSQSIGLNENSSLVARIRYRAVILNPEQLETSGLARLTIEFIGLAYATSNPLPTVDDKFFTSGKFGTATGASNLTGPIVRGFSCEPVNEGDSSVWEITYTVAKPSTTGAASRPGTGLDPLQPNLDPVPWSFGSECSIDYSSEDFVLGLGRYITSKTPAEMDAALGDGTYASLFNGTGAFEMVANSAGDPLESPPPLKIGTAIIRVTKSFRTVTETLSEAIAAATEEVCSEALFFNGRTFPAYTCKLNSASVTLKQWRLSADWLPKQRHPFRWTNDDLGWTPPSGDTGGSVAINYTRNNLPAYKYIPYFEIALSIAYRELGWGYALIDKGYRERRNGQPKEITDFHSSQSYSRILVDGLEADTSSGTTNLKVLRLYQVLKTGTTLSTIVNAMLAV